MIVLGVRLLVVGFVAKIAIVATLGVIALLAVQSWPSRGASGRAIAYWGRARGRDTGFGRPHTYRRRIP